MAHTKGPWEQSHHQKGQLTGTPKRWVYVEHNFPDYPYEGELEEEWGIYPPLGESGPVALVAGEANARLIAAAPDLLKAAQLLVEWVRGGPGVEEMRAAIAKAEGK